MDLGHRVRDLRNARHLSQVELAARAGVARNTLNRIENGHLMPTAPIIEHLARALDVGPGSLFEEPALAAGKAEAPPETGPPAQASEYWSMIGRLAEGLAVGYGVPVEDLLEVPEVALVLAGEDETLDQGQRGRTSRVRTPEQLLEQLHEHGIGANLSEASVLGQIVGMSDHLVEEDPVEWKRLGWLAAAAATYGLFTEDEAKAARETALRELGKASDSPHPGVEQIFMSSYEDEATQDKAWAEAREHAKEARWAHQSKVTVRDNREAVEVFVERSVADRMRAAHERAIRDEVRRANALDRTRGRV
jgi:transcriptional regulator with XRE-family HTH domain